MRVQSGTCADSVGSAGLAVGTAGTRVGVSPAFSPAFGPAFGFAGRSRRYTREHSSTRAAVTANGSSGPPPRGSADVAGVT
ncbi:hypothetical protein AB0I68_13595 [Streptomyces sp. NPDC050448]|uniref:hypothetical protein n=1 Tax=Streptomyces sp. NPDC050448 TaxID=3155404 RepID=UPI0034459FE8